jgi:hypothetical protein
MLFFLQSLNNDNAMVKVQVNVLIPGLT